MLYRPTLKLSNHKWLLVAVLITTLLMPALVSAGAGGTNIVRVNNLVDHAFRFNGSIELGQAYGGTAAPYNLAEASTSSCADCDSLAVALQISLVSNKASRINVQNVAMAVNSNCTRCTTVARALQYVFIVDDPKEVRPDISALIKAMDREFRAIHSDRSITLGEAEARINSVIRQYSSLANNLYARRSVDSN